MLEPECQVRKNRTILRRNSEFPTGDVFRIDKGVMTYYHKENMVCNTRLRRMLYDVEYCE